MFLAPEIFLGCALKILDRRYKIRLSTNHRAKFQAGRPTHLGDFPLNEKFVAKHKQSRNLGQSPKWVRSAP